MLVYSEVTGKKHNEALNTACNRFLLSDSKIFTKHGIFYTDLLPNPVVKQYILSHKNYYKSLGWLKFAMEYQKNVQLWCQLGL